MTQAQLRAFHAGDEKLIAGLVTQHSGRLLAYMRSYVADDSIAEDLVQETWLRAYRRRTNFRGEGAVLGWLLAISRTVALDHLRRQESRVETRMAATALGFEPDGAPPEALTQIESRDRAQRIRAALTELPPRQRDTVVMRILEDQSVRETARALGCAEGTVKSTLHQALSRLRTILRPEDEDLG